MDKKMKKYAAIDIGSNSIRLLVADFDGENFYNKQKQKETTRLRGEVGLDSSLNLNRLEKSALAVQNFVLKAKELGADEIIIYATSAVREAPNKALLLDKIKELTGLEVEVLSGEEEARVGFEGALKGVKPKLKLGKVKFLSIDVGGGSTELCLGDEEGIDFRKSYKLGVVGLQEDCFQNGELKGLSLARQRIEEEMGDDFDLLIDKLPFHPLLIGGTATTIGMHGLATNTYVEEDLNGLDVGIAEIKCLLDEVFMTPEEQRKNIVGVSEDRAKIILQGLILFEFILSALGQKLVYISEADSLEGMIIEHWS